MSALDITGLPASAPYRRCFSVIESAVGVGWLGLFPEQPGSESVVQEVQDIFDDSVQRCGKPPLRLQPRGTARVCSRMHCWSDDRSAVLHRLDEPYERALEATRPGPIECPQAWIHAEQPPELLQRPDDRKRLLRLPLSPPWLATSHQVWRCRSALSPTKTLGGHFSSPHAGTKQTTSATTHVPTITVFSSTAARRWTSSHTADTRMLFWPVWLLTE